MWELDHKEGWFFQTMVLKKTLESPLDSKEIKSVNPKRNQSWIFFGRTDAEAESPILWAPDAKSQLPGKDPDAGKDWGQEEKGMTEDEMVWWPHRLEGHELEQAPWVGYGQGSLVCCNLGPHSLWPGVLQSLGQVCWILKELDRIYWLKSGNQKALLLCLIAKLKCLYYET